ncbi:MAG: hypothetical protein K6A23_12420 [Butyrivibrio sp.]|nr:hypothetical protein [Butyrivibrio sp.]
MLQIKNFFKLIITSIMILIAGSVVGILLLTAVYSLPTEPMEKNVLHSIERYKDKEALPRLLSDYTYTTIDNFTDALMMLTAIFPGDEYRGDFSAFENALMIYHVDVTGVETLDVVPYVEKDFSEYTLEYYGRYWQGYLLWLKPLLMVFDIEDITIFNIIIQFVLLIILIAELYKSNKDYIIPFAVSIIILNPISTAICFQFSSVYYVTMIALIILLKKRQLIAAKNNYFYFFLFIGMAVVFFDFLTYPIISLCLPLVLYLLTIDNRPVKVIGATTSWGIGYVGFWLCKWILVQLFTDFDAITDAVTGLLYRGGISHSYSIPEMLVTNALPLMKWPFLIIGIVVFVKLLKYVIKNKIKIEIYSLISFILVALLPVCWYLGARGHSYDHYIFTFRNIAGTVCAVIAFVISIIYKNNDKKLDEIEEK